MKRLPDRQSAGPPPITRILLSPSRLRAGEGRVLLGCGGNNLPCLVHDERPRAPGTDVNAEISDDPSPNLRCRLRQRPEYKGRWLVPIPNFRANSARVQYIIPLLFKRGRPTIRAMGAHDDFLRLDLQASSETCGNHFPGQFRFCASAEIRYRHGIEV